MRQLLDSHDLILIESAIVDPIRRDGILDLDPFLIHGGLIYDSSGRNELSRLYFQYDKIALDANVSLLLCTPTWRTNLERVQQSGADRNINRHAVEFLREVQADLNYPFVKVGGTIGCKNDCYQPTESLHVF